MKKMKFLKSAICFAAIAIFFSSCNDTIEGTAYLEQDKNPGQGTLDMIAHSGLQPNMESMSLMFASTDFKNFSSTDDLLKILNEGVELNRLDSTGGDNCTIPTTRGELRNLRTFVSVYNGDESAGISIPGFGGLQLGKKEMSLHVSYLESRPYDCNGTKKIYGIGYTIHYHIKSLKKGLSLDKLPYVAASVQLQSNKTKVNYTIESHGISGIPLTKFFKPQVNKPFDVEGFGIIQSSIDGIHGILSDSVLSNQLSFKPQEIQFIKP